MSPATCLACSSYNNIKEQRKKNCFLINDINADGRHIV